MIIRISEKLNSKIKAGTLQAALLDENSFADWSAHLFVADRTQYVLLSNTRSLYSTVFYGAGITNDSCFIDRALGNLREFMQDDGQQFAYQKFVAPASKTVRFSKAWNRSITSSLNELIVHAKAWLIEDELSPYDVGFKLNDVLLSAIAPNQKKMYGKPREVFKDLVNSIKPGSEAAG